VLVAVIASAEVDELRAALAQARFEHYRRAAYDEARHRLLWPEAVTLALDESEDVLSSSTMDPSALYDISYSCRTWSSEAGLNPVLRWRLIERAHESARLAVQQAPADYLPWLWLARAQESLGQSRQAEAAWARVQALAPPGSRPGHAASEGGPIR
jgi:hypothetical protein